jgi:hypothetical protein
MVTPVRMLMSNLPAKASLIPLSLRMELAPCGLQLLFFKGESVLANALLNK